MTTNQDHIVGCGVNGDNIGFFKVRQNGVFKSFVTFTGTASMAPSCMGISYDDDTSQITILL